MKELKLLYSYEQWKKSLTFNSSVCTSIEQSQDLLEWGLKPETADMCIDLYHEDKPFVINEDVDLSKQTEVVPAWSLHRLIELYKDVEDTSMWSLENVNYSRLIQCIRLAIKHGAFNKEYLKQ